MSGQRNTAREDMDALLDEGIRVAIYFLEKSSEFFPFAVAMDPDGQIRHVEAYTGDEHPESTEVIECFNAGCEPTRANRL